MRGVLIAGVSSGSGKTTVSTGILSALKVRGLRLSAFKCGPDYIDPMFHRQVLGLPSFNLDPYFLNDSSLRSLYRRKALDFSVVEGVMGYYDGVGTAGDFSTYHVARALGLPAVLVLNAEGMATSAGAILQGFRTFRPESGVQGVIFNCVRPMMAPFLKKVAQDVGLTALGFIPKESGISIESRHLGLRTDVDSPELLEKLDKIRELAEKYIDLDGLLSLGHQVHCDHSEDEEVTGLSVSEPDPSAVRIAVARDRAFCFLYEENLEILRSLGAELLFFSPLSDSELPEADAVYLPGGYPELYLDELSENRKMCSSILRALERRTPTIAECGGFLYLHREVDGREMVGAIDGKAYKTARLQRFGYAELEARTENLLCEKGGKIRSHEFHYYESTVAGEDFIVTRARGGEPYTAGIATDFLYAGFPHLYFGANPDFAEHFVRAARYFRKKRISFL